MRRRWDVIPHQLSGGQRQRIAVARALLLKPKLLVTDEPVSMVDASLRSTILKALRKLNREYSVPIFYITHDLTTAYHISDYIIILYRGSVMEAGSVDKIIREPKHPYTQLLVGSIPWPDPNLKWGEAEKIIGADAGACSKVLRDANLHRAASSCTIFAIRRHRRCSFMRRIAQWHVISTRMRTN